MYGTVHVHFVRKPDILVLKAGHPGVLVIVCFVFVLFWCGVLGLVFFFSYFTTNLASMLYTCIYIYMIKTRILEKDKPKQHTKSQGTLFSEKNCYLG